MFDMRKMAPPWELLNRHVIIAEATGFEFGTNDGIQLAYVLNI